MLLDYVLSPGDYDSAITYLHRNIEHIDKSARTARKNSNCVLSAQYFNKNIANVQSQ